MEKNVDVTIATEMLHQFNVSVLSTVTSVSPSGQCGGVGTPAATFIWTV